MNAAKPEPRKFTCETCVKNGVVPTGFYYGGITPSTCMAFYPFLDADGRQHFHDGNSGDDEYWYCDRGHDATEIGDPKPKCWCGWPYTGPYVKNA